MRYLYTILFYLILPFVFLRLLWRSRSSVDYRKRWSERLGYSPFTLEKCIWIHAASVGETIGAIPLIKGLQKQYPQLPILVTNMTITGAVRTKAAFGNTVLQMYVPYDLPAIAQRFLKRTNPVLAIFMETELWPNIFVACHQRQIPIVVANARLSEKSAKGYQRVANITQEMLNTISSMAVQTQVEGDRFISLGLSPERVVVTGSIKFDVEVSENLLILGQSLRAQLGNDRLVWIAASTHAGEEEIILNAHSQICAVIPNALLILVPRHPERFNAVYALAHQQGFQIIRRSENTVCSASTQIYLGDTMGELLVLYAACDVAFVAGSFAPVGGHNMLEAAVLAKPIVVGPQLFNFAEISALLLKTNSMLKVDDATSLSQVINHLFQDAEYRKMVGDNACRVVEANRGAVDKHLKLIAAILPVR